VLLNDFDDTFEFTHDGFVFGLLRAAREVVRIRPQLV
jgi:hypothetical protein